MKDQLGDRMKDRFQINKNKMIKSKTEGVAKYSYITVICAFCKNERQILLVTALKDKSDNHSCKKCSAKMSLHKKPQCTKEYWTDEKVQKIKDSLKTSEKYKEAIRNRDLSGEKNGMYGKKSFFGNS